MNQSLNRRTLLALIGSALLAAFSIGWVWQVADGTRDRATVEFNQAMTNHHAQAVSIGMILHEMDVDPDLRTVARDIVLTQQAQIGAMGARLDTLGAPRSGAGHRMIGMASPADIAELQTLPPDAAARFGIDLLIAHHRGGVQMARDFLSEGLDRHASLLAERIVTAQESEIELLEKLAARYPGE